MTRKGKASHDMACNGMERQGKAMERKEMQQNKL
jgi:hypothetical protein